MLTCLSLGSAFAQISTPEDITNLIFWADGKDVTGTGVQPANGSTVTTWVDKAGGNDLTLANGSVTFEEAGFDGIHPALRFNLNSRMAAPNPFSSDFHNQITVFFINSHVTYYRNVSVNLNGLSTSGASTGGRSFLFHTPWPDGNVYFDASGCCSTRLRGNTGNLRTETTLYSALSDQPGGSQLLRIDGQAFRSDLTGHNSDLRGGVHLGAESTSINFDGRFAEFLIYDRALSLSEIEDVECFLLLKWKLDHATTGCSVNISAQKTIELWTSDDTYEYALPGNNVIYTLTATHESGPALDAESMFLVDVIPTELTFYNGDIDDDGPELNPVKFAETNSGLTWDYATDVGYSDSSIKPTDMSECLYSPVSGYDPAVRHICIQPSGSFLSGTPDPTFDVSFRMRID